MAVTAALFGSVLVAAPAQALNDTGSGGVFVPASGRILDTKNNIGGYNTPMPVKTWRTITVGGKVGVPNDGTVGAVSVVATVADVSGQGILYGRPNDTVKTTTMGVYGGENKQNTSFAAVLAVDEDGTIEVQSETAVRLILDVQGYYTTDSSGTAAGGFVPLNGERIVDTRSALGAPKVALAPGKSIDVQVTGKAGIPAGASAAVVNMIAVNTTSTVGYLTPYPTGGTRPSNSFNYAGGVITSMSAQVKLSASGKMTIFNDNSTTNVVVDIQGYFTAAGAGGAVFTPAAGRVYDTRTAGNTVMGTNETRPIQVAGVSGIPVMGSGIVAVVLTMTSLKSTSGGGNATVWADGTPRPYTTAINFDETTIRTNTITVPLGANGKISLGSVGGPTNYVFDIQGWYTDPVAPTISCPEAYAAGTWGVVPGADITCTATAPAASSTDSVMFVSINEVPIAVTNLNQTQVTTVSFSVAASMGWKSISASTLNASDGGETTEFAFGLNLGTPSAAMSAIQKASPDSFTDIDTGAAMNSQGSAMRSTGDFSSTVPLTSQGSIELESESTSFTAGLPFPTNDLRKIEAPGIVSYDNQNGSTTVPLLHLDGTVQIATVIDSASAPTAFDYPITIPAGGTLSLHPSGAALVKNSSGFIIATVDPPWARDANGQDVPTSFVIEGDSLVQQVNHRSAGVAYPVVADPSLLATLAASANCAVEIATIALAGAKALKILSKVDRIVKASKAAIKAYKALGGTAEKLIKVIKKYIKKKTSLSKKEIDGIEIIIGAVGSLIFDALGLPTCFDLIRGKI